MRIFLAAILILTISHLATAQEWEGMEEATAGNFFGPGSRQMSMGGTGIASSIDIAALYYNPAAMTRIHRVEIQLGLTHQKFSNESSQPADRYVGFTSTKNTAADDITKTRLGSINLAVPVPTYRGSLVVGAGINRIMSFDRTAIYNVVDYNLADQYVSDYAKRQETGGIYMYTAGAAIEASPYVSFGLAVNIYSGDNESTRQFTIDDQTNDFFYDSTVFTIDDYIGISLKGGFLIQPNANMTFGLTVESPVDLQIESFRKTDIYAPDYFDPPDYSEAKNIEYDLKRPFVFGAGFSLRYSMITIAADAEYTDWSQLSYNDNITMEMKNDSLSDLYHDVLNLRVGAEYQFPKAGLALRAGLFRNPLPYQDSFIEDDRTGFSFGFGWLIDRLLLAEAAYVHGGFTRKYTADNAGVIDNPGSKMVAAEDSYSRLYLTLSYRY